MAWITAYTAYPKCRSMFIRVHLWFYWKGKRPMAAYPAVDESGWMWTLLDSNQ